MVTIKKSLLKSWTLYRLCKAYVRWWDGSCAAPAQENDFDPETNGEYRLLAEVAQKCHIVFDVGANCGEWTGKMLSLNPRATIHCFEPCAATHERLLANAFPRTVVCNKLAMSDHAGIEDLHICDADCGCNSLYQRTGLQGEGMLSTRHEQIQTMTLDDYCASADIAKIDFLKIDVEGHELSVLKGARRMLHSGCIERIQFEYGGTYIDSHILLKDVYEWLVSRGYKIFVILPDTLQPAFVYEQRLENFQYKNFLAVHARVMPEA